MPFTGLDKGKANRAGPLVKKTKQNLGKQRQIRNVPSMVLNPLYEFLISTTIPKQILLSGIAV